jgi:hypothetical protein
MAPMVISLMPNLARLAWDVTKELAACSDEGQAGLAMADGPA